MRPVFLLLKQSLSLHHMNNWKQWNVTYIIIIWWFTPCLVLPILYKYRYLWQKIGDYWWITQYRAKGMNKAFSVQWKPGKRQWPQKKRLKILVLWKPEKKNDAKIWLPWKPDRQTVWILFLVSPFSAPSFPAPDMTID